MQVEEQMHVASSAFMAITANIITAQASFHQDLRSSLASVGLQCAQEQCLSLLSVVGITFTYLTWIHMLACIAVLYVYMLLQPDERGLLHCVMAIAGKAPELPGHPAHKQQLMDGWSAHASATDAGSPLTQRGSLDSGPPSESRDGPVPRVRQQEGKELL